MAAKVVIVTGASRGIGLAISELLAKPLQKCNVVAVARSQEPLDKLKADNDGRVQVLAGDLADASLGKKAVDLALSTWGRLDGLCINHGRIEPVERVADADVEQWKATFDVNFFSALGLVKAAIPELRKTKGKIILTSSGAAVKATAAWGAYGASKALMNHFALTLAAEEKDITTISIRPGVVATEMQETLAKEHYSKMDKADADKFGKMRDEKSMLRPEQPGNVMARLVLEAPAELSGRFLNWNDESLAKFQDL